MDSVSIRYLPRIRFRFRWIYLLYLALAVVYNISGFHLFALTNRQITGVGVSLAHFGFLNNSHLSRVWRIYYYDTWERGGLMRRGFVGYSAVMTAHTAGGNTENQFSSRFGQMIVDIVYARVRVFSFQVQSGQKQCCGFVLN